MNATRQTGRGVPPVAATGAGPPAPIDGRKVAWISAGALAVFVGLRLLPTGTNLSHMDFRVEARDTNAIEFCDPLNPQFIPVVAARSPVTMTLGTGGPATMGSEYRGVVTLRTGSAKPVAPEDLLVVHTRSLHLLIVDPTLTDYQHVHPVPGKNPGEWTFSFLPQRGGLYRIFADFTPVATGRGLYASVDLPVGPVAAGGAKVQANRPAAATVVEKNDCRFSLVAAEQPMRAGAIIDLRFSLVAVSGGAVPLQPVMGAFAHLVAFDETRSGFAHLHPTETDLLKPLDAQHPGRKFELTIPQRGRYVIWAQVNLGGREVFVPFWFEVFSASGGK